MRGWLLGAAEPQPPLATAADAGRRLIGAAGFWGAARGLALGGTTGEGGEAWPMIEVWGGAVHGLCGALPDPVPVRSSGHAPI
jgi:hypothetical protein